MRSASLRQLFFSSICFLASASIGALLSIATHLPARFGGLLSGNDVARDFLLINGTALSPDMALLLAQLILTISALQRGRRGHVGVIGLTILGACYTVGQLGEPITLHSLTPATFNLAVAAVAVTNIASSIAMFVFGVREWRDRRAKSKEPGPALHTWRQPTAREQEATMITKLLSGSDNAPQSAISVPDTQLHGRWLLIARVSFSALLATVVVLNLLMLPDFYASQFTPQTVRALQRIGLSPTVYAIVNVLESVIPTVTYLAMGCLIFWRRSNDRMALFCAVMLVTFGGAAANPLDDATGGGAMPQPMASIALLRVVVHLLVVVGQVSIVVFFYLLPTGRFVPRWTRWCALLALVFWSANVFFPTQVPAQLSSGQTNWILFFWLVGVIAQAYRYWRVSTPVEREQTKWIVFGVAIAFTIVAVPTVFQALPLFTLTTADFTNPPDIQSALIGLFIGATWVIAVQVIAIFIAIAILRSHLWDIDIIINRALVYGLLTTLLAVLYAGLTIGLEALIGVMTGRTASSVPVVIVASTLAIAALFQPLRRRIQAVIDRRFYRRKYDAAKTLAGFGATLRSQVDLNELQEHLLSITQQTMQPVSVSLWLRPPNARKDTDRDGTR